MPSESGNPGQNNSDSIHKEPQSAPERYIYPPFASSIEVNFPRRIEEKYNSDQEKQQARDKWKFRIEIGTALFIGLTVVVNSLMWNEMQKTTQATKLAADAAAASTTALITVERFVIKSIEKDQILFDVVFKNIGKTPALDARAGWEFAFITGPPNDLTANPKYDPYQCPNMNVNLGILAPDKTWGTNLPTGSGKMTVEELQMIKNRAARIFVHGCAKYRDILTERERITEVGVYYPGNFDPADLGVAISYTHSRMK